MHLKRGKSITDFVKVNLNSGYSFVAHKNNISLTEGPCGKFYANHLNGQLDTLHELLTKDGCVSKEGFLYEATLFSIITKEEYDRLCKELGLS